MRVTEQVLGVVDYGGETEDVLFCADSVEEARKLVRQFHSVGPFTICRVRIVEVIE